MPVENTAPGHTTQPLQAETERLAEELDALSRVPRAVRETEERFRIMADCAPVLLWTSGPDKLRTFFNQPWLQFTGRTMEQEYGHGWAEGVHRDDFDRCRETYLKCFDAREPFRMEYRLRRHDGDYRWILDTGMPRYDADGTFAGYIGACIDISERKQMEEQLRAETQELQKLTGDLLAANKELETFCYTIAHDLRAPLRAMDGFSRLLLDERPGLDTRACLSRISESAQHMGRLVDGLLNFARFGRQALNRQQIDPAWMVQAILNELEAEREGRHVDIRVADLPACRADPVMLKQIFVNLLSNALKYTRAREVAHIEVGWQPSPGSSEDAVYFVKDNGIGFDMRYHDRLFGIFQRLHRTKDYEGAGVGLAIVQRLVQRHGGSVWADAAPDQGATFFFTLGGGKP